MLEYDKLLKNNLKVYFWEMLMKKYWKKVLEREDLTHYLREFCDCLLSNFGQTT